MMEVFTTCISLALLIVLLYVTIMMIQYKCDIDSWNDGYCRKCGGEWQHKETDKNGVKYYECYECGNRIKIVYKMER